MSFLSVINEHYRKKREGIYFDHTRMQINPFFKYWIIIFLFQLVILNYIMCPWVLFTYFQAQVVSMLQWVIGMFVIFGYIYATPFVWTMQIEIIRSISKRLNGL
jgi:hypothetical protein